MGKTKVGCKKLDNFSETESCVFCSSSENDEINYGPIYSHKNIITHYFCLLLSSNMEQNGRDAEGILGFLLNDILKEIRRGAKLNCTYCRQSGATLGCAVPKCKVVFHLPCGLKHSTLHQYFGEFKSYCNKHRPVQRISPKILANSNTDAICGICYDKVVPRPVHNTLWAPCCQKNAFFHRDCVQKLAISAGYFFKCPLCNNTTTFQQTMKEFGVYIPEQDASWESVPQAYQELLVRHDTCDSPNCTCPGGKKTNVPGTRWELILCKYCGSQGVHIGCGRLKWHSPEFQCNICSTAEQQPNQENTINRTGHRLSPINRSANSRPFRTLPSRELEDSDSSIDSDTSLITNKRRMRVVSPVHKNRQKLGSSSCDLGETHLGHLTSDQKKREKILPFNTIVIDDEVDEKPVVSSIEIDDSDSDDDVQFTYEGPLKQTSLKTADGVTIPIVKVDSQVVQSTKRLRVVGDVEIEPTEIVDIKRPEKKTKLQPIKEVIYSLPNLKPKPSTSQSVPLVGMPQNNYNRFMLVDSNTLQPNTIPPGTLLYRSIQPQPPQTPMQQLEPTCHADSQYYTDLCKHGCRGCDHHFSSNNKSDNSMPRGWNKRYRSRCRRRCDMHRMNPRVLISRLKSRISSAGHLELFVPWMDLHTFGFSKRRDFFPPLPIRKMKQSVACHNSNGEDGKTLSIKSKRRNKCTKDKRSHKKHQVNPISLITNYFAPAIKKEEKQFAAGNESCYKVDSLKCSSNLNDTNINDLFKQRKNNISCHYSTKQKSQIETKFKKLDLFKPLENNSNNLSPEKIEPKMICDFVLKTSKDVTKDVNESNPESKLNLQMIDVKCEPAVCTLPRLEIISEEKILKAIISQTDLQNEENVNVLIKNNINEKNCNLDNHNKRIDSMKAEPGQNSVCANEDAPDISAPVNICKSSSYKDCSMGIISREATEDEQYLQTESTREKSSIISEDETETAIIISRIDLENEPIVNVSINNNERNCYNVDKHTKQIESILAVPRQNSVCATEDDPDISAPVNIYNSSSYKDCSNGLISREVSEDKHYLQTESTVENLHPNSDFDNLIFNSNASTSNSITMTSRSFIEESLKNETEHDKELVSFKVPNLEQINDCEKEGNEIETQEKSTASFLLNKPHFPRIKLLCTNKSQLKLDLVRKKIKQNKMFESQTSLKENLKGKKQVRKKKVMVPAFQNKLVRYFAPVKINTVDNLFKSETKSPIKSNPSPLMEHQTNILQEYICNN